MGTIRTAFPALVLLLCGACSTRYAGTVMVGEGDSDAEVIKKATTVVAGPGQLHALENGFEAFVHFGPNTFNAVEWGSGREDPSEFALNELDTDQWCEIFKAAGMKRVILTAKHHDGFVLWPSRYTSHGVASSPFKGDVVASLSASCRKYGLEFGFYLSPADLYQMREGGLYGNGSSASPRTIPRAVEGRPFADGTSFEMVVDDYNEYFLNQLFELLTEYGPVAEIWFDGAHPRRKGGQQYDYQAWKSLIRALAPEAVVFGKEDLRWCGNEAGRTRGSEWNVIPFSADPATLDMFEDLVAEDLAGRERLLAFERPFWLHYQPAETDVSIRDGWFWRDDVDQAVRSADDVFDIYERAVGGNSILLLNVPPTRDGRISSRDSTVLREVGRRINDCYGTDLLEGARRRTRPGEVEFVLPRAIRFNRLSVGERPDRGERVEEFAVDVWLDGWQEIARGTNIGYRRILRFEEQNASRIRIRAVASRAAVRFGPVSAHLAQ